MWSINPSPKRFLYSLKNKKGVQINQMKMELAQLLETGQERTARIRVEHVTREEKMVVAYDLIEIYCELIVARFPIIESQKTCPVDLKEAVTSGKDFVSAAIELHPDCGVSRMLVEKLSAIAPDLQTKIKVLSVVAKDHNIDWDPTSFEEKESKPSSDLLNGPVKKLKG
ncbi:putative vacuolar protein sorting-associated protein Ist1 [Helianthus annuus]|nr:putative vacuolar protein sorting-associated protein Ist1 [Helianthus annuus]